MALFSPADMAEFLGPDGDLGETVTVAGADIPGLYLSGYEESQGMQGSGPVLLCRAADVSNVAEGAAVAIPSAGAFTVGIIQPDSQGLALVTLEAT